MNDESELKFKQLFDQLPVDDSPDPLSQTDLRAKLLSAHREGCRPTPKKQPENIGRLLMKYKIPQLATLAASLTLAIIFLQFSSPAFAIDKAIEKIVGVKAATFDLTIELDDTRVEKKVYVSGALRREEYEATVSIQDDQDGKILLLHTKTRHASLIELDVGNDYELVGLGADSANLFATLQNLLNLRGDDSKLLGPKKFADRELIGYAIPCSELIINVWSDVATTTPVRIEFSLSEIGKVVMDNYQPNVELDASLFSFEVPQGYEVDQTTVDASKTPTEEDLLRTLRLFYETNKRYPQSLGTIATAEAVSSYASSLVSEEDGALIKPQELQQKTIDFSQGFTFASLLGKENEAYYDGRDKTSDQVTPIFWYRPSLENSLEVSKTFRVIYNDLTIRELADAPRIEGAEAVGTFIR